MKICYVWVEKFRNFENLGLNLSSNIKFKYDSSINELDFREVDELPINFFGDGISEITGIIGKNGSGKSNALELICKVLKGGKTDVNNNFFVIVEEERGLVCYYYFKNCLPPKVKNNLKIEFEEYSGKINPIKVVFFSNVFDDRRNGFNSDISDISVNNLLVRNFFVSRNRKLSEFEKQINFIKSRYFETLEIGIPNRILVTLKLSNNKFSSSSQKYLYDKNYEKVNEIRSIFRSRLRELIDENKLIQTIKYGFFFDIYEKVIRDYGRNGNFGTKLVDDFQHFIGKLSINGYTDEITDEMMSFLENKINYLGNEQQFNLFEFYREDEYTLSNNKKTPLIIEQLNFIKDIKYLFSKLNFESTNDNSRNRISENFIINYDNLESIRTVNSFIRLFQSSSFINVNWLGISSGHKAYLNLFSSVHNEIKNLRTQNLLICIDEGDLYLHPKWQIEFFNKLVNVLPKIYSGNIQLILTSHSPFLLSDLPNQNITILNEQIENSSSEGIDLAINTFGGNLYDLYSEPFFLGNKRTSDFAYEKIKQLIDKVESKDFTVDEKSELVKLVNILGDEIIQFRIKSILKND